MNRVLALAAIIEGLTGLAMIVDPVVVTRMLLGGEVSNAAIGLASSHAGHSKLRGV